MPFSWQPEHDRKLLALKATGAGGLRPIGRSFADIARLMNSWFKLADFTKDMVQKRYQTLTPPASPAEFPLAVHTPYYSKHFEERTSAFPEKHDLAAYLQKLEDSGRSYKTLVISDQQGIFCDNELQERILEEHPDADLIVIPGDVCDWEGASRYVHDRDYPLAHEADWLVRLYEMLTTRYPGVPVVVTSSNHQRRVRNAVRQLPQGLLFLAEHNPEKFLAQPFADVHAIESWWFQSGDVIYAHAEGTTTHAGDNTRSAIDIFFSKLEAEFGNAGRGDGVKEFRVVVTGHSHKLARIKHRSVVGIEPGCLAKLPMAYMRGPSTKAIQEQGYAVIVQERGRAIPNECREWHA